MFLLCAPCSRAEREDEDFYLKKFCFDAPQCGFPSGIKSLGKEGEERGKLSAEIICSDLFSVLAFYQGAFWGLMAGLAAGLARMIMEFAYSAPACGEVDRRPAVLKDVHYLYFALILCALTAIVIVIVSLCTAPIPEEKVSDLQ